MSNVYTPFIRVCRQCFDGPSGVSLDDGKWIPVWASVDNNGNQMQVTFHFQIMNPAYGCGFKCRKEHRCSVCNEIHSAEKS